jgi:PAS domain S-box-containing protein
MHDPLADDWFRAAIEQSRDAIVITTAELDAPGPQYVFANPAFEQLTGYSPAEILGKTPRLLQGPLTERGVLDRLARSLRDGGSFQGETINYRKDGTPFHLQWSVAPLRDAGGVTRYFMAIQRDVTEQKRIEAIAESLNLVNHLGFLVAGLRHELGGPFSAIKTTLAVLRAGGSSLREEDASGYLDRALEETARVDHLLGALRSLNSFEQVSPGPLPLGRFLDGFGRLMQEDLQRRGVALRWETPAEVVVWADAQALHQILLNLVANSAHALDGVPGAQVVIRAAARGKLVELSVQDNGHGMNEDQLRELFRPFRTQKPGGSGLGLVIVRKLAARMRGTLRVESLPAQGTTVTLTLESAPA